MVGVLYFVWAVHAGDVHTLLTALQLGFKAAIRFWMMAAALSRFDMLEFIGGHYGLWWKQGERGHSSDIHAWRHNEARAGPVMTEETHGSATIDLHLPVSTTNWCVEIKKDQLRLCNWDTKSCADGVVGYIEDLREAGVPANKRSLKLGGNEA